MQFFKQYEKYVADTEPPKNFHVWTGISTISALLGRKCYIPQGFFTVHPNLYVVLVGPAGVKKSSSMNIGKGILRSVKGIPLAPASTTREALIKVLADSEVKYVFENKECSYFQATAFVTELQEFIGGKHINEAMIGIMTALWDEPKFEYVTANKQPSIVYSPYFTLLGCCTNDWVTTKLKSDVISDGFSRRVIFVLEKERSGFQPWPTTSKEKEEAHFQMVNEAKRIHLLKGKFRFTAEALELWKELYVEIQNEVDTKDAYVQNYYSTKHILMLKVAMCLSAASDDRKIVDSKLLRIVHTLFLITEENLLSVFSGLGRNELSIYQNIVLDFITEAGEKGVTYVELLDRFTRDLCESDYEEVMSVLFKRNLVKAKGTNSLVATSMRTKKSRKNLFELLRDYKPDYSEKCLESDESELSRMVDQESFLRMQDTEERVDLLKRGILITKERLAKVSLKEPRT